MHKSSIKVRNRDLGKNRAGLAVLSAGKRGKVDLYGTFKFHVSYCQGEVDKAAERLEGALLTLRDAHAKRDGAGNVMTSQRDARRPNDVEVVIADPMLFERDERQILDTEIELDVPTLKMSDVLALDLGDVPGDYRGALPFIVDDTAPAEESAAEARAEPRSSKKRREA